jgi:Sigma-70, region 4
MPTSDRTLGEHDRMPGEQDQTRTEQDPTVSDWSSMDDFESDEVTGEFVRITASAASAAPAAGQKLRRHRRTRPRGTTIAMRRVSLAELQLGAEMYPPVDLERPRTRADCGAEARPCPWVACKHHLYLDINPVTGSIKINFPDREPWELEHTCALDIAEAGGKTLDEIGEITNLTRERIRQVEVRGLLKLRSRRELR